MTKHLHPTVILTLALASLLHVVHSEEEPPKVKLGDVFNVAPADIKGGCTEEQVKLVELWFADSLTLVASATECIVNSETEEESLKYLTTFFSIDSFEDANPLMMKVRRTSNVINAASPSDEEKPWLFCNSDWAEEQTWSSVMNDLNTGEPREDGMLIEDAYPPDKKEVPFWAPIFKQYLQLSPGNYCDNPGHYGGTQDMTIPSTVTLCVENIRKAWKKTTLADLGSVTRTRAPITNLQPQSLTLFHEFVHLALGPRGTPDHSYNIESIVKFETEIAQENPESYTLWALAYYLGQKNPKYSFASSSSARK